MKELDRRTVAKGALWSVPAVTVAAATPTVAASKPNCPTCLKPGALGAYTAQAGVINYRGALIGNLTANIDARHCDLSLFKPVYTILGLGATMTMSDGSEYVSPLAGSAGIGTLGQISAYNSTFTFANMKFPAGTYTAWKAPVQPKKLCLTFRAIFIGLPHLIEISCEYKFCYTLRNEVVAGYVGPITGSGTVNYSGSLVGQ